MMTFTEQMEVLATQAGERPLVFILINKDVVTLHEPFSPQRDHIVGAIAQGSKQRWTLRYDAVASAYISDA